VGMKSVRFDAELERMLGAAAELLGVSESEVIRHAVAAHCSEVLRSRLDVRLADYVGSVRGGGGRAEDTGGAFARLLKARGGRDM